MLWRINDSRCTVCVGHQRSPPYTAVCDGICTVCVGHHRTPPYVTVYAQYVSVTITHRGMCWYMTVYDTSNILDIIVKNDIMWYLCIFTTFFLTAKVKIKDFQSSTKWKWKFKFYLVSSQSHISTAKHKIYTRNMLSLPNRQLQIWMWLALLLATQIWLLFIDI